MPHRALILLLTLIGLAVAFAPLPAGTQPPVERTFRIQASQFAYQPAELSANPGDTVHIELVSTDVVHGLYVDGYGVSVRADPGQSAILTFVADKPGSFRLRCNVTCGAMHPFMIGKLNVGPNLWLYRSIGLAALGVFSAFVLSGRRKEASPL